MFLLSICFNPGQDSGKDSQFKFNIALAYKTPEFCFGASNSKKPKSFPSFLILYQNGTGSLLLPSNS